MRVTLSRITQCPPPWGSLEPFPNSIQEHLEAPSLLQGGISPVGSHKDMMSFKDIMGVVGPFLPCHDVPHCSSSIILG